MVHSAVVATIVAIPAAVEQDVQPVRRVEDVRLIAPRPVSTAPAVRPPRPPLLRKPIEAKPKPFVAPPVHVAAVRAPEPRLPEPKIPEPKMARVEAPPAPVILPSAPPAPKPIAAPAVKVGGFGDVNGVRPSAESSGKGLMIASLGAFDLPSGAGAGGGGGASRVVATGGFGDAAAGASGATPHGGQGAVRSAGFGAYEPPAAAPRAAQAAAPRETPVEITFKPKPVYTSLARAQRVEGEVQLEVLFCATGRIEVLRVVRGLGFGLDDSAREAAARIRFRPGTRDGNPVDMRGIVHIVFELS